MTKSKISIIFTVFVMFVILAFTSQSGDTSSELSRKVTRMLAKIIFFEFDSMAIHIQEIIIKELNRFVRKAAHFSLYSFLGFSVFLSVYSIFKTFKMKIITAFLICVIYAGIDEFRQLFISERESKLTDVLIDTCGSVCGIVFALIILFIMHYMNFKKRTDITRNIYK